MNRGLEGANVLIIPRVIGAEDLCVLVVELIQLLLLPVHLLIAAADVNLHILNRHHA